MGNTEVFVTAVYDDTTIVNTLGIAVELDRSETVVFLNEESGKIEASQPVSMTVLADKSAYTSVPSIASLGRTYWSLPFHTDYSVTTRVMVFSTQVNTIVTNVLNGNVITISDVGGSYETLWVYENESIVLECSAPCLVFQQIQHPNRVADLFYANMYLPSKEQFTSSARLAPGDLSMCEHKRIGLMTEQNATGHVVVNGNSNNLTWAGNEMQYATLPLENDDAVYLESSHGFLAALICETSDDRYPIVSAQVLDYMGE